MKEFAVECSACGRPITEHLDAASHFACPVAPEPPRTNSSATSSELVLAACPFCGNEPELVNGSRWVECSDCRVELHGRSPEDAIAAWNRRAGAPVSPPAGQPPNLQTERRIQGWAYLNAISMNESAWTFVETTQPEVDAPKGIRATLILHYVAVPVGQEGER